MLSLAPEFSSAMARERSSSRMRISIAAMALVGLFLLMGITSSTTPKRDVSGNHVITDDVAKKPHQPLIPDSDSASIAEDFPYGSDPPKDGNEVHAHAITHHHHRHRDYGMFGDLRASDPDPSCTSKNDTCDSPFDVPCCQSPNNTICKMDNNAGFPVCQDCAPTAGAQCSPTKPCCEPYKCQRGMCAQCGLVGKTCSRKNTCCLNANCVSGKCKKCGGPGFTCRIHNDCCRGKQCSYFRDKTGRNVISCQKCSGRQQGAPCKMNTNMCCRPLFCVPNNPKDLDSPGKCGTRKAQIQKLAPARSCLKRNQPCDFIDDPYIPGGECCADKDGKNVCAYNLDLGFVTCVPCVNQAGASCGDETKPCCRGFKCQNGKCAKQDMKAMQKCFKTQVPCKTNKDCCPGFNCVNKKHCDVCRKEGFICFSDSQCCTGMQCFDNKDKTGRNVNTCETCEGKKVGDECTQGFNRCCKPLVCLSTDPMDPMGDGKCDTQANKDKRDAMVATMTTTVPPPTTQTSAPPRCEKEHYTCDLPGDKKCCQSPKKTVCMYDSYRGHSYAQCVKCNDTAGAQCSSYSTPCCDGQKCVYHKCVKCAKLGKKCKTDDDCCHGAKCEFDAIITYQDKCVKCGDFGFTCKKDGDCCPKYQCFPHKDGDRQLMQCRPYEGTRPGDFCNAYSRCKKPLSCVVDPMSEYGNGKCQHVAATTTPSSATTTPPPATTAAMMG